MSMTEYYKQLKRLFSATPPSGGAKKSGSTGNKKAVSKSKKKTTIKTKMKTTSRKSATGKVKKKTAGKTAVKKTTVKAAKKTVTKKTFATVLKKKAAQKAGAVKASVKTTTAKPKAAETRTISSAATRKITTAKPKTTRKRTAADNKASVQRLVVRRSLNKGLENLKQRVEASKFFTPIQPVMEERDIQELPHEYMHCRLVCMVRDPYWVHAYWEITDDKLHEAEGFFGKEWGDTKTVLRVHDITSVDFNGEDSNGHFDIELSGNADSWYINVNSPNSSFVVDITRISPSGKTFILARSNTVTTPRDGMSDILDEEWMSLDFEKMYALSGGFKVGMNSQEMHELMKERMISEISSWFGSGAVSSFGGSPVAKRRGFWFVLDCELIVYGATEPDAKVTMQGRPIALRPDGTFTVRFALPDGVQEIKTTAVSADDIEERTITPTVSRKTESYETILKES